jgi:hypothetical protein
VTSVWTKTAAALTVAGGLTAVAGAFGAFSHSDTAKVAPPQPTPATNTAPADTSQPPPASNHFNNANGSDYVLVCQRGTSLGRMAGLSDADKAKATQYEKDMLKVAKDLVANPTPVPALTKLFTDHTPVVMKIIAWDASISKADIGKIDIIPHETKAGQVCPADSSPVAKLPVP